ncbi:multiple sugar transport system ATP-binding protein [Amaricoccus macauensis]|uniref:Multiple sugar transport system ATP-binding protein n=1 Tax=Amaricoccus macauensis TaxID=57001 RepID=A0A840SVN9_9RHOB|nr:ABC transporter ATP-binding protein [Amaricoccus macauensis]MBB5223333.1 multiple sugar transport system ATP-binding protein [Amaricoccus macauensis]
MATVELSRVWKRYGQVPVIHDVSLRVEDGEFMVLLGPSGCGKSTTLRMIAGLESISEGEVRIDDRLMNGVPAKARDIAMVFQSYALYPHMNVRENLGFGLRRRSVPREEIAARVAKAAASLGLEPYLDRRPHALSGGQRQRVAVGRAIVRDPKVFLFDEPLSNLDAALRVSTRAELTGLHRRLGATMVYVTHDQVEAMTMGSRICIMQDGRVAQVGTPMEVYREPANAFVAGFLGAPPMNLLSGRAEPIGGGTELRVGEAVLRLPQPLPPGSVTVGVRPETLQPSGEVGLGRLEGRITSVEQLGAETIVAFELAGAATVRARLDNTFAGAIGEAIALPVRPGCLHVFDPETGALVLRA